MKKSKRRAAKAVASSTPRIVKVRVLPDDAWPKEPETTPRVDAGEPAPAAQRRTQVRKQIDDVTGAVMVLEGLAKLLRERLRSVLPSVNRSYPGGEEKKEPQTTDPSARSPLLVPLANELRCLSARLHAVRTVLSTTVAELEV